MRTPPALLRFIARAALNIVGGGLLGDFAVDVLPEMAKDVWKWWNTGRLDDQLRAELQAMAQLSAAETKGYAELAAQEEGAEHPETVRQAVANYVALVPNAIRQSQRRPGDPSGLSLSPDLSLCRPEDLLLFLPRRMPRFRASDRPSGIGDWELQELLGVGGFGEVWKAGNPHLPHAVAALKFCTDSTAAKVLRNEAALLGRVMSEGKHRGIVRLLHTYLNAETPCLEYEYVSGGDLSKVIAQWHRSPSASSVEKATQLVYKLGEIVGFAHGLKPPIVHRDLKPANILLHRIGKGAYTPRVADFGIGGVVAEQALATAKRRSSSAGFLSTALRGAHTPLYASPQQVRGEAPDPRDDVHALGVIWYQLLTGDLNILALPADWQDEVRGRGLSDELLALLSSCLASRAEKRPADANELARRIKEIQTKPLPQQTASAAPVASSKTPSGPPVLIVSQKGDGQFTSLTAAVHAASPYSRIIIWPGLYQESIVLDKPLQLVGEGLPEEIILQTKDANCLVMKAVYALVRGLTIRCIAGAKDWSVDTWMPRLKQLPEGQSITEGFSVDVLQGKLVLENCNIVSEMLSCLRIKGPESDPTIRNCVLRGGSIWGLHVSRDAHGTIEDCTILENTYWSVALVRGCNPIIRRCTIGNGSTMGVVICKDARGVIEDCTIAGTKTGGIAIIEGSNPQIVRCKVVDCAEVGIAVGEDGRGIIEDCEIARNGAGVGIITHSNPRILRCRINANKAEGIAADATSRGTVEDCDLTGNLGGAWKVEEGGQVCFRNNRVDQKKNAPSKPPDWLPDVASQLDMSKREKGKEPITAEEVSFGQGTTDAILGGDDESESGGDLGLSGDPDNAYIDWIRGDAYRAEGDYDRAIADCSKAIRLNPSDADAYFGRGRAYLCKGEYASAIADFTEAIRLNSNDAHAYELRGEAQLHKGDYERAIADFNRAIRLDPKYSAAYRGRGQVYTKIGDHDKAIADFRKAIRRDPNSAYTYALRGTAYFHIQENERAIADFSKAIRLDPTYAYAHGMRGWACRLQGYSITAVSDLKEALRLDPSLSWAEEQLNLARRGEK
ncbi:MAG TPA: tetratricopeptide repeat protein [Gemmataceae bacterium]|jgi:tetratricopeptide (TPR) repeat protein/serine/threonine protein kinase